MARFFYQTPKSQCLCPKITFFYVLNSCLSLSTLIILTGCGPNDYCSKNLEVMIAFFLFSRPTLPYFASGSFSGVAPWWSYPAEWIHSHQLYLLKEIFFCTILPFKPFFALFQSFLFHWNSSMSCSLLFRISVSILPVQGLFISSILLNRASILKIQGIWLLFIFLLHSLTHLYFYMILWLRCVDWLEHQFSKGKDVFMKFLRYWF